MLSKLTWFYWSCGDLMVDDADEVITVVMRTVAPERLKSVIMVA